MRRFWACLIALLVAVTALTPACAHPLPAHSPAMAHHGMPANVHHDCGGVDRCIGCGMTAIPASDERLAAPMFGPAMPPIATLAAALPAASLPVTDPPPRFHG